VDHHRVELAGRRKARQYAVAHEGDSVHHWSPGWSESISIRPSLHELASQTTGMVPPSETCHTSGSTFSRMTSWPDGRPLDFHGVPQHNALIPRGVVSSRPARWQSATKAADAP
jgi:hypothetical protein